MGVSGRLSVIRAAGAGVQLPTGPPAVAAGTPVLVVHDPDRVDEAGLDTLVAVGADLERRCGPETKRCLYAISD